MYGVFCHPDALRWRAEGVERQYCSVGNPLCRLLFYNSTHLPSFTAALRNRASNHDELKLWATDF